MSATSQRIRRSYTPGYWAVEIRQSDAAGLGKRYLCRAQDEASARAIAARLMGSALSVRGFSSYWIELDRLEQTRSDLPPLGEHQLVSGAGEWLTLMAAHEASERAALEWTQS